MQIEITIRRHRAYAAGDVLGLLRGALEYDAITFPANGQEGRTWRSVRRRLWRRARQGQIRFAAGLVPSVRKHLESQGHDVRIVDTTRWTQFDRANQALLVQCPPYESEFLRAIAGSPRGQLVVQQQADVVDLIAMAACFFERENIFLVAKNNRQARRLEHQLRQRVRRFVSRDPEGIWKRSPRIYVGCPSTLSVCNADDWTVTVVSSPAELL